MSKTIGVLQGKKGLGSNEPKERAATMHSRIARQQSLPFLLLEDRANSYPDTGESGDAYDVEAIADS
jgi:hypothetical protein